MTTVSLDNANEAVKEFKVTGHANAERVNDYDLVCCASSILLYTLLEELSVHDLILNKEEVEQALIDSIDNHQVPNIRILIKDNDKHSEILETILNGYKLLEQNYPKNVQIKI